MQLNSPPRKAIRFSHSQDILRLLCNPGVRYRNHNSQSVVRILIQVSPVHTRPFYFFKIHCNIMLLFTPSTYSDFWPSGFSIKNFCLFLLSTIRSQLFDMTTAQYVVEPYTVQLSSSPPFPPSRDNTRLLT